MHSSSIEILGIYRLPVTDELFHTQFEILHGFPMTTDERQQAERDCRHQLESTVLIEALVKHADSRFSTSDFAQPVEGKSEDSWQAAWAEAYLSEDGERLLVKRWGKAPESNTFRIAFFIHFWDLNQALRTSYGDLRCPAPEVMPERLKRLVPYEPVD